MFIFAAIAVFAAVIVILAKVGQVIGVKFFHEEDLTPKPGLARFQRFYRRFVMVVAFAGAAIITHLFEIQEY